MIGRFWRGRTSKAQGPGEDLARQAEILATGGLFDRDWYLATYPDVAASGDDPIIHYLVAGAAEGRDPGPGFDTIWYLAENSDVQVHGMNPLVHFIEHGRAAGLQPRPLDAAQRFESFEAALRGGVLDAARLAHRFDEIAYPMQPARSRESGTALPLPAPELAARIGSPSLDNFEEIGRRAKVEILRCLPAGFSFAGARCLDFGCGVGRVMRHFVTEAQDAEFWGCDIDGTSIRWATENLSPPFRFFQLGPSPLLPLESSSFDLVYALAVFSQAYRDWQLMAMEIRRILKPGGVFFMTFNGQTSTEEQLQRSYADLTRDSGLLVKNPYQSWNKGGPTVVMSPAWIEAHWGSLFDIDFIAMEGFDDYQSIALLRKPAPGPLRAKAAPVLHLGTSQDFHPDATGKIILDFDPSKPFGESYGIDVAGTPVIRGWIVFRNDAPADLALSLDGDVVPAAVTFSPGDVDYRDWGAPAYGFEASPAADALRPGSGRLTVTLRSRGGLSHALSVPLRIRPTAP